MFIPGYLIEVKGIQSKKIKDAATFSYEFRNIMGNTLWEIQVLNQVRDRSLWANTHFMMWVEVKRNFIFSLNGHKVIRHAAIMSYSNETNYCEEAESLPSSPLDESLQKRLTARSTHFMELVTPGLSPQDSHYPNLE